MIKEDYISFEIAKHLKEKGFDEECRAFYVKSKECGIELFHAKEPYNYNNNVHPCTSAPTLQMTMKWLREVHHITIGITFSLDIITYEIQKDEEFITAIGSSRSYEDMVEDAIKYCLENLI